jgi:hypothetical protein
MIVLKCIATFVIRLCIISVVCSIAAKFIN